MRHFPVNPIDLASWRSQGRVARALRAVLMLLVVLGLTPGAAEIVEAAEHLVHDGHLPHGAVHDEVASAEEQHGENDEHGCTPTQHHCQCCASLAATPPSALPPIDGPPLPAIERVLRPHDDAVGPRRATPPPVRPPIA